MSRPLDKRKHAQRRGLRAEAVAAWWLRLKGYRVLAKAKRMPVGELDLVVCRGRVVAFVEVKARHDVAQAAHAISANQRRRIQHAAEAFMAGRPDLDGFDMRFDAVLIQPWRWPLHLRDAWRP